MASAVVERTEGAAVGVGVGVGIGTVAFGKRLDMPVENEVVGEVEGIVVGAEVMGADVGPGVKGDIVALGVELIGDVASTVGREVIGTGSGLRLVGPTLVGKKEGIGVSELEAGVVGPCVFPGFLVLAVDEVEGEGPGVTGVLVWLVVPGLEAGLLVGDNKAEVVAGLELFTSEGGLLELTADAADAVTLVLLSLSIPNRPYPNHPMRKTTPPSSNKAKKRHQMQANGLDRRFLLLRRSDADRYWMLGLSSSL
jgi:hypothetical protein